MLRLFTRRRNADLQAALDQVRRETLASATAAFEAWQSAKDFETQHAPVDDQARTRAAYDTTPLLNAAVGTVSDLVLGTGVTYGQMGRPPPSRHSRPGTT